MENLSKAEQAFQDIWDMARGHNCKALFLGTEKPKDPEIGDLWNQGDKVLIYTVKGWKNSNISYTNILNERDTINNVRKIYFEEILGETPGNIYVQFETENLWIEKGKINEIEEKQKYLWVDSNYYDELIQRL